MNEDKALSRSDQPQPAVARLTHATTTDAGPRLTRAEKEAAFAAKLAAEDVSAPSRGLDYRELKTMVVASWPEMVREHAAAMATVHTLERKLAALRSLMVQCSERLGEPVELPPWPSKMFKHKGSLAAFTGEKRYRRASEGR